MSTPPDSTNGEKKSSTTANGEGKPKSESKRPKSGSKQTSKDSGLSFDTAIPVLSAYGYALGDTLGKGKPPNMDYKL
jgi:hypothetical protein